MDDGALREVVLLGLLVVIGPVIAGVLLAPAVLLWNWLTGRQ